MTTALLEASPDHDDNVRVVRLQPGRQTLHAHAIDPRHRAAEIRVRFITLYGYGVAGRNFGRCASLLRCGRVRQTRVFPGDPAIVRHVWMCAVTPRGCSSAWFDSPELRRFGPGAD